MSDAKRNKSICSGPPCSVRGTVRAGSNSWRAPRRRPPCICGRSTPRSGTSGSLSWSSEKRRLDWGNMRIQCSNTNSLSAYEEAFDLVLDLFLQNSRWGRISSRMMTRRKKIISFICADRVSVRTSTDSILISQDAGLSNLIMATSDSASIFPNYW